TTGPVVEPDTAEEVPSKDPPTDEIRAPEPVTEDWVVDRDEVPSIPPTEPEEPEIVEEIEEPSAEIEDAEEPSAEIVEDAEEVHPPDDDDPGSTLDDDLPRHSIRGMGIPKAVPPEPEPEPEEREVAAPEVPARSEADP